MSEASRSSRRRAAGARQHRQAGNPSGRRQSGRAPCRLSIGSPGKLRVLEATPLAPFCRLPAGWPAGFRVALPLVADLGTPTISRELSLNGQQYPERRFAYTSEFVAELISADQSFVSPERPNLWAPELTAPMLLRRGARLPNPAQPPRGRGPRGQSPPARHAAMATPALPEPGQPITQLCPQPYHPSAGPCPRVSSITRRVEVRIPLGDLPLPLAIRPRRPATPRDQCPPGRACPRPAPKMMPPTLAGGHFIACPSPCGGDDAQRGSSLLLVVPVAAPAMTMAMTTPPRGLIIRTTEEISSAANTLFLRPFDPDLLSTVPLAVPEGVGQAELHTKLVLLGDDDTGKRALLDMFRSEDLKKFTAPRDIQSTAPVVVTFWTQIGFDNPEWKDTEKLPPPTCFLLCFGVNNVHSFESIRNRWSPLHRRSFAHVPVLLVGTKSDLRHPTAAPTTSSLTAAAAPAFEVESTVPVEECEALARAIGARGYMECSTVTGQGLEELLIRAVMASPQPQSSQPPQGGSTAAKPKAGCFIM
ncbi:hypothetical protein PAPYR_9040 [Paratrimastix pyriformis]|uniref:Uncharacterized protein n=1 Tax=Paratrimastix pyriformis TaxID=342808 RepID=A0ABQ8UDG9_9EUKA|nr:hypothetical protein PAPYR_9040 [Paratrimastix pyriformis]